jgi:pimeloyl-[acyl-carrier protein] methyl ester esterase
MTKQKHFYLLRGLIREKGHWGLFLNELKNFFPDALITPIDIPGAGEYYQSTSPLSIKGMVEHMRQDYLKAKKDNESSHLIAISLGGMISVEWMKHYPHDFEQATLINTSFGGISPVFHRLMPSALAFLLKVPTLKGRAKESRILKLVSNHEDVFNETLDMWEDIQKNRPVSLKNTLRQLAAGAKFKVGDFKPSIPIQLLGAVKDRMVSIECSRAIAKRWSLTLEEHPTGGHDLTVDAPEWVASKIREFTA